MNADEIYRRYRELQRYVGWTDADAERVRSLGPLVEPHLPELIDDFYAEIERHDAARKVLTGGGAQVERLKVSLAGWLRELFAGRYDRDYVVRRWRVGGRHVAIGLDQAYVNVALSRLRSGLFRLLDEHSPGESLAVGRALNSLLDLDLAIIEDAYQAARLQTDLWRRVNELQTLLDVIPIGIAITQDRECSRIQVNPALARLLRTAPGSSPHLGAGHRVLRNGQEVPAAELPLHRAAAQGTEVRDAELDIVHPDGSVIHLYGSAAPLRDEQGRPRGAVAVFLDVTERKRAQEQLLQTERLAAIGQMVTGLAHESGNALARSQSCLEMLAWEVEDRPAAIDLIGRIQKAQDHLRQLYEEVRGYAAPLKLARADWGLPAVWRQAWENLAVLCRGRDAVLSEEAGGIGLVLPIDPFRLDQVFRNVFENSLAACPDPVRIEVRCWETTLNGSPAVCVSVRDNGPGLSAEARRRIFDPFYTTKTKGTGLGMAIASRIAEAHGGRIAIGPGPGAEILITLPRQAAP